jgi:hypothetical protein
MIAEKPKKNQYPAYALKSDDGENEEHSTLKPGQIIKKNAL